MWPNVSRLGLRLGKADSGFLSFGTDINDIESSEDNLEAFQSSRVEWADWPDEKLLELRFCDLSVTVEGSQIAEQIRQLNGELADRGFLFRPHFWLSNE